MASTNAFLDNPLYMICGNQRSGTNLLLHYLDSHPELHVLPEETALYSEMFDPKHAAKLASICETHDLDRFLYYTQNWWFFRKYAVFSETGKIPPPKGSFGKSYPIQFSMDGLLINLRRTLGNTAVWNRAVLCRAILFELARALFGEIRFPIVAKNHGTCLWLPEIIAEDSNLRIMHMVRNPFNILASEKSRHQRAHTWYHKRLLKGVNNYITMKKSILDYPENVLPVRFEELTEEHGKAMQQVCEFIGIDVKQPILTVTTILGQLWYSNTSYQTKPSKAERFVTLTPREYRTAYMLLKPELMRWAYPDISPPSFAMKWLWYHCLHPCQAARRFVRAILRRLRKRGIFREENSENELASA